MLFPVIAPASRRGRPRHSLLLTGAATVAGLALLVWQVRSVGLAEVTSGFAAVGAGFLVVLVVSGTRFVLRAAAWRALLLEPVRLRLVVAAAMAGDALGNLTPLSIVVGEPAKAIYLSRKVSRSRAFSALTAENFFYSVSVAIYVVLGTAAMLVAFPVPDVLQEAGVVALGMMAVVLTGAVWLAWQRPSVASAILQRLPVARLRALAERVRAFEDDAYGAARRDAGRLTVVLASETTFHVLSFLEVWYLLWLLTGESLAIQALVLDTFSRIVNVVFKVIPLRLGVDESVSSTVAQAIALTSAVGLTLALVRKGRMIVWSAVGVALVARRGLTSLADPRSPSTS